MKDLGSQKSVFMNLGLFQFLSFVRRGIFYTFMVNYLYSLMKTVTSTALLGTFNMAASALGQNLLWGKIADRHHLREKLIIAGELIAAAAYFIVFQIHKRLLNTNAEFTAGISIIFGLSFLEFFWSMSDVGWAALLTDLTTTKTRGGIVGALNFVASLGRMAGIIFAGFLYNEGEGFRNGRIFYIVIAMLLASAAIMWITSRFREKRNVKVEEKNVEKVVADNSYDSQDTYKWFLASLILVVLGMSCTNQVFLLYLKLPEGLNASDSEMSFILTAWTLGGMLTSLSSGWLADKFGRVKLLMAGFILGTLTPALYGMTAQVTAMALVYCLNGVAFWTIQTVGFAFAGDIIPESRRGRLFSKYNTVMALSWGPAGFLIGGPLADFQIKSLGMTEHAAYVNAFYASSIIVTLGIVLFMAKIVIPKAR